MRSITISFNKQGYDGFIDFIKAYAIVCVLLGHSYLPLPKIGYCVWAGMQVPLFILIQVFHCYKREQIIVNYKKVFSRVLLPFFVFLSLIMIWKAFNNCLDNKLVYIALTIKGGGYFPWIYFQISLFLPLFSIVLKRLSVMSTLLFFLIFCESFELIFSFVGLPEEIYRLLAVRYFFLVYLGWLWVKFGVRINLLTIILSLISLASIIYFEYYSINDEPCFFSTGWKYHRWPCYFWVAYGLTALLYAVWCFFIKIQKQWIINFIKNLAASSYEIFLVQMTLINILNRQYFLSVTNEYASYLIWLVIFWVFSLVGGFLLHRMLKRFFRVNA